MPGHASRLHLRVLLLAMQSWLALASAAASATPPTDPRALFAAMREASGGERWSHVGEIRVEATFTEGGLHGTRQSNRDTHGGRYVTQSDVGVNQGSAGFDGKQSWMQDEKGLVTVLDAATARRQSATDAYLARNGWFSPASQDTATMAYLGESREDGRLFQRVRVTPAHGDPVEAWIDANTHLLARLSRRGDDGHTDTTYYADYRPVDGLHLPFSERESNGDASYDSTRVTRHVDVLEQAADTDFVQPESLIRDARIVGGAASAQVPFERYGGLILVQLSIDGHAPMPFILDSGGLNLLTPDAARELGIQGKGNQAVQGVGTQTQSLQVADVGSYRLGPVQMEQQRFLIIDLPLLLTDRGDRPAIAGLIGYELLRRFTTRIDYDRQQLTFSAAGSLRNNAGTDVLPLSFAERTPMVHARVNGIDGVFMMDTGDSSDLTVFEPFAKAHGIALDGKVSASHSGGVGGIIENRSGHVASFALDQHALLDPPATLSAPKSGVFASELLAGNIGQGVLSRYAITLDYESRRMQLQPGNGWAQPFEDGPSLGFGLDRISHGQYQVLAVTPSSPARRVGLAPGDIVVALDGVPASRLDLDELRQSMRHGGSHGLTVTVLRKGKAQELHIEAAL
ncbi:aspartyl protease family protein [Pinirhizobacter soli]|uniref:aspartyl protease family protein n=1 Tax=Pinirhizobacter soli TaxID=2786953 RepID=UPI00202A8EFD|nr:aspartyl protease family protein [Pinirhizobacter soli]